jgi:FKBP-type peptidyl-prolyl cis-trans isomerase FklB
MNLANTNLEAGRKFLSENKDMDGVITHSSGFQYKVLENGKDDAKSPTYFDNVICHYEGRFINGKIFDSSYKRNKTEHFPINGVISGWSLALPMMKEGDKWEIYLPTEFAYGRQGAGKDIGPNETLIFIIELISIV